MAVIEPLRKSPSSRIWVSMRERCCSRAARDSGKGHLQSERKYTLGLYTQKKETAKCLPVGRTPLGRRDLFFLANFGIFVDFMLGATAASGTTPFFPAPL